MVEYLIGVDVGTGSARAGVFDPDGRMLGLGKAGITIWHEPGGIVEQSSDQIWQAVCQAVRQAMETSGVAASEIAGIGFDATCSLVVLGAGGRPLAVGPSGQAARDVIVWMDHRAIAETGRINATGHPVLRHVGGVISPEMQTPKLLWLARNLPETFAGAWQFMDLADFLTWRASGSLARSTCTVTCKWTYLAHENRWDDSYFRQIGLGQLADEGFSRIGTQMVAPGTALGRGLGRAAADDLGLLPGIAVGAGLIDAHAGGLGTVGACGQPRENLGYVFGTSSCTMTTTDSPVFVPGVWGPYYSAMVPGVWLNEGGQSAAGAAIDRLVAMHPAHAGAAATAGATGLSLPAWLADQVLQRAAGPSDAIRLAQGLHVVPEFLGNRAPFADPRARAVISGLGMEVDQASLIALYVAGIAAIGYGLRQIIAVQAEHGAPVRRIVISGGAGAHPLIRQLLADATGTELVATEAAEPVLLGAAILGGLASGMFPDAVSAMRRMTRVAQIYVPSASLSALHDRRFDAFSRLQALARQLQD